MKPGKQLTESTAHKAVEIRKTKLALPGPHGFELISAESIYYCKAEGNYTSIYFYQDQKVLISRQLSHTVARLKNQWFLRIHHSYMVNMRHACRFIRKSPGQLVLTDGTVLPISKKYRNEVIQTLHFI